MSLNLFLQVLALVFFALGAAKTPEPPHLHYGWAGAFLLTLTLVFGGLKL